MGHIDAFCRNRSAQATQRQLCLQGISMVSLCADMHTTHSIESVPLSMP